MPRVQPARSNAARGHFNTVKHCGGSERGGRDFIRYLKVAKGSAAELRTQCYIACRIGILDQPTSSELVSELKAISRMLSGLAKAIKSRQTENRKLNTEN
jgi:hypothetical protein